MATNPEVGFICHQVCKPWGWLRAMLQHCHPAQPKTWPRLFGNTEKSPEILSRVHTPHLQEGFIHKHHRKQPEMLQNLKSEEVPQHSAPSCLGMGVLVFARIEVEPWGPRVPWGLLGTMPVPLAMVGAVVQGL